MTTVRTDGAFAATHVFALSNGESLVLSVPYIPAADKPDALAFLDIIRVQIERSYGIDETGTQDDRITDDVIAAIVARKESDRG